MTGYHMTDPFGQARPRSWYLWVQVGINSQYWGGVEMKGKLADITGIMMTS
jgi:hypothetical protein